jgi:uncharacterized protein (DUF2062 family)
VPPRAREDTFQPVRSWLQRLVRAARRLWQRALNEHSTPREVGWSVFVGVFSGCTPFLGLHMWVALALATIFRLNRLWAFLGSRVSSNVLFVWITFVEIELAHRLRAGAWASLAPREALNHGRELLGDWFVGSAFVGPALGGALGLAAYVAMVRRGNRAREERLIPRTPDAPHPPTSESPRSAPPAPSR